MSAQPAGASASGEPITTSRLRSWWITLWAGAVLVVLAVNIAVPVPAMVDGWPWVGGLMAFPVAAAVVLLRRPGNSIGRLLFVVASTAGVQFALTWIGGSLPNASWAPYTDQVGVAVSVGIFGGILGVFHLFPDGRPVSPSHRRFLVALAWCLGIITVLELVAPGVNQGNGKLNPMGIAPGWVRGLVDGAIVILPIAAVVGIVVLVRRTRRATPVEREQLRWFFVGSALLTAMFVMFAFVGETEDPVIGTLLGAVFLIGFWSLPVAIVVAVTRYRLYDIDRVLSRSVSYLLVAGILTGVYVLSVLALQVLLPVGNSQIAVAASTLGAAALFTPVRRGVHQRIERRFNRARYEARAVTQQFTRRLQREFELDVIEEDLATVIAQTMQPTGVQVWLRP